jgi:hypothetical protein
MAGDGDTSAENGQTHGERSVFNGLELSSPQRVEETPEVMEELEKDNKGGGGPQAAAPAVTTTGEGVEGDGKSAKGAGKAAVPKVPFMQLFKFADAYDKLLMVLGFLGAVGDGATTPGMLFVMSGLINVFGQKQTTTNFMHEISKYALYFVYIAIGAFVACYLGAFPLAISILFSPPTPKLPSPFSLPQQIGYFALVFQNCSSVFASTSKTLVFALIS